MSHAAPVSASSGLLAEVPRISALQIRQIIIEQSKRAGVGHIGSALCVADILSALYGGVIKISKAKEPDRDRFVLSKGHAALALYATLFLRGVLTDEDLSTFCADDSSLGVHPELVCKGIDFATGSLGQGLSFATGAALAAKTQKSQRKVYVLASDAECNEGSVWEAVMFAAHHQLDNLIAIIDMNGQQAFGYTKDVINLSPMATKWAAFGWNVLEVDGHDVEALQSALVNQNDERKPTVILAKTTFGKGVSYMENQIKWHYSPLSDDDFQKAQAELQETV